MNQTFLAKLTLGSARGSTFREQVVEIKKEYTKDAKFLNLVDEFKKEAVALTLNWEQNEYEDHCFISLEASNVEATSWINQIKEKVL